MGNGKVSLLGRGEGRLANRSYEGTDGRDWRGMAMRILGESWNDKLEEWDGSPHARGQGRMKRGQGGMKMGPGMCEDKKGMKMGSRRRL